MTQILYPDSLPPPDLPGYQLQPGPAFVRGAVAGGRAQQRRGFVSQPAKNTAQFTLSDSEFMLFEGWFRYSISDGADWFLGPAKLDVGVALVEMRFVDMYSAALLGSSMWQVQAQLEIREWR